MVIGMQNKELIKTIILVILVLMSGVLTYMTWNFSPDLANVDNQTDKDKQTHAIGKPLNQGMEQVVTPYQIIHSKGEDTEGVTATKDNVKTMLDPLMDQRVTRAERMHSQHNLIIPDLSDDFVVLDFTYDMPLATYLGQSLNISAKIPNNFKFNRLLIDQSHNGKVQLYAVSKDRHDVVRMTTTAKTSKLKQALSSLNKKMQPYTEIITSKDTIDKATHIYAPDDPKGLKSYRTIYNRISVDAMNAILFNDSLVVRSAKSGTTTYNNNTGVANYNDETERYRYTNLSEDEDRSNNMKDTIPSTFDYINSHGGFTDDFRLFSTNNDSGELTYQLFLNGRPTFNEKDLNQIKVSWSEKGIFSYARSLLKTNVTIDSGDSETDLPGAEEVRSSLANNRTIDFEKVTDLAIGYTMNDKPDNKDIEIQRNSEFTPQWYVEYDGKWHPYKDGRLE
ncbi:Two-component system YycF/YycG regulatory protein YycH [Staphylococcus arlettae]|uniref:YycH protein n=2 Tax=Staphylococcus arlettae TaxID=29378 RepID=A0A380BRW4_9STAP|nr:Two-component system YycF/YycG regulatory protein YycH [Staphylococcus arlettae]SUJ06028.1 YycH protein [Staphylococcus arlettae]